MPMFIHVQNFWMIRNREDCIYLDDDDCIHSMIGFIWIVVIIFILIIMMIVFIPWLRF